MATTWWCMITMTWQINRSYTSFKSPRCGGAIVQYPKFLSLRPYLEDVIYRVCPPSASITPLKDLIKPYHPFKILSSFFVIFVIFEGRRTSSSVMNHQATHIHPWCHLLDHCKPSRLGLFGSFLINPGYLAYFVLWLKFGWLCGIKLATLWLTDIPWSLYLLDLEV